MEHLQSEPLRGYDGELGLHLEPLPVVPQDAHCDPFPGCQLWPLRHTGSDAGDSGTRAPFLSPHPFLPRALPFLHLGHAHQLGWIRCQKTETFNSSLMSDPIIPKTQ
jgi:hypothetical protein